MIEIFTSKLGHHRGGRRIWLEGKRLDRAGFRAKETYYVRSWHESEPSLVLAACEADQPGARRVSGKGDKPVIDITGQQVAKVFAGFDHVAITYMDNLILIEGKRPADQPVNVNSQDDLEARPHG